MAQYNKSIHFIDEAYPAEKWLNFYNQNKQAYLTWYLQGNHLKRPGFVTCQQALEHYMPKFKPLWQHLLALTDANDIEARLLSLYCPPAYVRGCSQAIYTHPQQQPFLIRNYDYHPDKFEGLIIKSHWHDNDVIAVSDCLWGVLDGMNESGLCASLAFGGEQYIAEGFGIPLIMRYIVEFCHTVEQAIKVLDDIPSHMAYNITLLDRSGQFKTVEISADHTITVIDRVDAFNHQSKTQKSNYTQGVHSFERQQFFHQQTQLAQLEPQDFRAIFQQTPLKATNYQKSDGTLYTAIYHPKSAEIEFLWPDQQSCRISTRSFKQQSFQLKYFDQD